MFSNHPWALLFFLAGIGLRCLSGAVAQAQTAQPQPAQLEGRPVTAIRIADQSGNVLDENVTGLPLQLNQPFTLAAERESLRQLYRRGRYADIVAQVTTAPEAFQVDFVVRLNFFINAVRVTGLHEPPTPSLTSSPIPLPPAHPSPHSPIP